MKIKLKALLTLGLAAGAVGTFAFSVNAAPSLSGVHAAKNLGAVKYIPVSSEYFYKENGGFGLDGEGIDGLVSRRRDTFHDGRRQYNALDNFINTMAKVSETQTGWIRSHEWVHTGGYVSFLLGGNSDCFVNIWVEPEGALPGADVFNVHNDFYASRNSWDEAYQNGTASDFELSANMALKYYHIPDQYIGRRFIVYISDSATSYYGGITFGDLRVNQSLEDVARTFTTHKQQIALDATLTNQNGFSATYMLDTYYKRADRYGADNPQGNLIAAEAALNLDNVDDGFETYGITNWVLDGTFSGANIDSTAIVSSNDAKDWNERMPANKSDNYYLNADTSGIGEGEKYRLISNEFTLSGSGFISAKLGGGTAVLALIDSTGTELVNSRIAASEGENKLNPGFKDASVANVMTSGARLNTMSRTYLDASSHVGKKVRVVLSDDRTGGGWGLAYFDEVVTKYTSVPTLKVDAIEQQWGETPLYHGVVTDKYVGPSDTDFGKAYDFVNRYYEAFRANGNGASWCTVSKSDAVKNLLAEYKLLDADVQALVDAAMDYSFGAGKTGENWFLSSPDFTYTVGQTMAYLDTGFIPSSSKTLSAVFGTNNNGGLFIMIGVLSVIACMLVAFIQLKKKKASK